MRELALRVFSDNSALRHYAQGTSHLQDVRARRSAVKIAVIDDEPFAPQANLLTYGYRITPIGDIKDLKEVAAFHMILCDIMGVGRHFDASLQGASLISEIKKSFPEKVVVAYTGAALNERAARLATARADMILKKDIDIEEWTTNLDRMAAEATDPYVIWNKIRARFIELQVKTKDIIVLEDAYVRSVRRKDPSFRLLTSRAENSGVQQDARAILQGLASSLIFQAIFPGVS